LRYRFVLSQRAARLALSVTPFRSATAPEPVPTEAIQIQTIEDWLPEVSFYRQLSRLLPEGEIKSSECAFQAEWRSKAGLAEQIIAILNEIASPYRYGRTANSYLDLIGRTPLVRVERLSENCCGQVLVKMESMEPGSVKDRAVAHMVAEAVRRSDIGPNTEVVEASSGNLAFALSAILGVTCDRKPTIFMSKMHGPPKRRAVRISGSRIVLTNAEEGTRSAKRAAVKYAESRKDVFQINQHGNPDNPGAHRLTTGPEIYHQAHVMAGRPPDEIICSVGSGGTAIGLCMFRDDIDADFRVIGVEPENASLLTGGDFNAHHFSGMAPGWITDLLAEHGDKLDEVVTVTEKDAFETCREMLVKEGLLVGPSSGAAISVALRRACLPENEGKVIVAFAHDRGDRYLDIEDLFVPPLDATEQEVEDLK